MKTSYDNWEFCILVYGAFCHCFGVMNDVDF
jgi:hypothetical protein